MWITSVYASFHVILDHTTLYLAFQGVTVLMVALIICFISLTRFNVPVHATFLTYQCHFDTSWWTTKWAFCVW